MLGPGRKVGRLGRQQIRLRPRGRSASGSAACAALEKKPDRDSRSIKARPAKPPPTSQRNSRRERPHGVGLGMKRESRV